ncbi:MAG: sulfur carrier protein ThiS [Hyphomicrobiaceae bacterium]
MSGRPGTAVESLRLTVNGELCEVATSTLAALLIELGYGDRTVATALNGDFVPERARAQASLKAGDQIEIVAPRQGG